MYRVWFKLQAGSFENWKMKGFECPKETTNFASDKIATYHEVLITNGLVKIVTTATLTPHGE